MNGTFYGALPAAKAIFMKVLTSIRKSITSPRVTKLPVKIDFAIIWFACKRNSEKAISILFLIPISFQMSSVISMPTTKNSNNTTARKTYGS
jgi:hypothetical protein